MRFGIDALDLLNGEKKAGIAHYIYNLVVALTGVERAGHEIFVYVRRDFHDLDWIETNGINLRRISIPSRPRGIQFIARVLTEHLFLASLVRNDRLDTIHFPNHVVSLLWPVSIPRILTVHDLTVFSHPQTHSRRTRFYFRQLIPLSVARATHIVCDAQSTVNDLQARYRIQSNKVDVVHPGVSAKYHRLDKKIVLPSLKHFNLEYRNYILFLGNLEPRKNIDGLIRAYHQLVAQSQLSEKLVIIGKRTRFHEEIFELVEQLRLTDRVIFTGYVADEVAVDLYNGAVCFVYPSHYEGFGLPVLEAMACGLPVITSNVSSLPEIAGDAGLLIDPSNTGQLASAIEKVLRNPTLRLELGANSVQRAKKFSWPNCAQKMLQIWERSATIDQSG